MVEIHYIHNHLVMKARNSELVILPAHVSHLHNLKEYDEFQVYLEATALLNRTARKLYKSWCKKNPNLFKRIYKIIHENSNETVTPSDTTKEKVSN